MLTFSGYSALPVMQGKRSVHRMSSRIGFFQVARRGRSAAQNIRWVTSSLKLSCRFFPSKERGWAFLQPLQCRGRHGPLAGRFSVLVCYVSSGLGYKFGEFVSPAGLRLLRTLSSLVPSRADQTGRFAGIGESNGMHLWHTTQPSWLMRLAENLSGLLMPVASWAAADNDRFPIAVGHGRCTACVAREPRLTA
ncbi:hypothetical protein D3C85_1025620 [compost metagenome]